MVLVMSVDDRAVIGGVMVHKVKLDISIVDLSQEVDTAEFSLKHHVKGVVFCVVWRAWVSDVERGVGHSIGVVSKSELEKLTFG